MPEPKSSQLPILSVERDPQLWSADQGLSGKEVGSGEACGFSLQGMSPAKQAEVLWKSLFWLKKDSQEWEWSH